jgi:hypothetical protein
LNQVLAENHANAFFSCCPRFGEGVGYEKAWQIRLVLFLWADLDNTSVEQALERCKLAGLPEPTIVVSSGNGVHLYWKLVQPYSIDDAGDPQRVDNWWEEPRDTKLSEKAKHIQRILKGIACKIGGDHTTSLAQLLRLPCTLNRKDERNGATPKPCVMVVCEPERRYPLSAFAPFAMPERATPHTKPSSQQGKEQGTIIDAAAQSEDCFQANLTVCPPPELTAAQRTTLDRLMHHSATAKDRSRADFSLCCWAVEQGISSGVIWDAVKDVGKFGQRNYGYFECTWKNAVEKIKAETPPELIALDPAADPTINAMPTPTATVPSKEGTAAQRRHDDGWECCPRPFRKLMRHNATGNVEAWWVNCRRPSCTVCLAQSKREKREAAATAIDSLAKLDPRFYIFKVDEQRYAAVKGRPAAGHTTRTPTGFVIVTTVGGGLEGATATDAAGAKSAVSAAIDAALPRGGGKQMCSTWGDWRIAKEKKEPEYHALADFGCSASELREAVAPLGVKVKPSKCFSPAIQCRLELVIPPEIMVREVVDAILSKSSVVRVIP